MEIKKVSIGEAKKRIKNDPELSKLLVKSGWREIALDLNGDGKADVAFSSDSMGRKIDTIAFDLSGNGGYNLYLHDMDGNGIPDTVCLIDDNYEEKVIAFGGEVELGFINLGVKVANLLVAEEHLNKDLGISIADLAAYFNLHAQAILLELEKRENATGIEKVYYFLNDAQTYYLATIDGDKPRVRPFGTILLDNGKLYIQTGKVKDVSKQIAANPNFEICAFMEGTWLRVSGKLVEEDNRELKVKMLEKMPSLKAMYSADDDNTQILAITEATAPFASFTGEPEVITL